MDLDEVEERVKFKGDLKTSPPHPGWKARTAGGDHLTPNMPPDIFEEEGIQEMSRDELRDRFSHAPYPPRAVYDGEKIFIPPWPGSDDDPTIIERFENAD